MGYIPENDNLMKFNRSNDGSKTALEYTTSKQSHFILTDSPWDLTGVSCLGDHWNQLKLMSHSLSFASDFWD